MTRNLSLGQLNNIFKGQVQRPTALMFNRLEGRPRTTDFSRALKAEARDALWMVTRQWQMGEFEGEDAASPAIAKIAWRTEAVGDLLDRDDQRVAREADMPIEAQVESRPVVLATEQTRRHANLRLALGRHWARLLKREGLEGLEKDFVKDFGFPEVAPNGEAELSANAGTWQFLSALTGRAIDGGRILLTLLDGKSLTDGTGISSSHSSQFEKLGEAFLLWVEARYVTPDERLDTWVAKHLEYDFAVAAPDGPQTTKLCAPEYHGGRLDWYHYDAANGAGQPSAQPPDLDATSFLPTQAQFDGMPNTRHWAFEEGAVNFGGITPDTTDIAKLLLIEFGLVYANDWFVLPLDLPYGSLTRIEGLSVTNVFGERTWIEAATAEDGSEEWGLFRLTEKGRTDDRLFLPAVAPIGLESAPVEAVDFGRDEVANMVWGVERVVSTADGAARRGRNLAQEMRAWHQARVAPDANPVPSSEARHRYQLMSQTLEHWIPFVPVHVPDSNREIQLQRAAMPRMLDGASPTSPAKIRPRTDILREGLDDGKSYFIAEEEVARAGTIVETRWQRVRWHNGRVVLWLGNRRFTGRGEIHSGLAFDQVLPNTPDR